MLIFLMFFSTFFMLKIEEDIWKNSYCFESENICREIWNKLHGKSIDVGC